MFLPHDASAVEINYTSVTAFGADNREKIKSVNIPALIWPLSKVNQNIKKGVTTTLSADLLFR